MPAQATFESILDTPTNLIERPKPLPVGTYQCITVGQPRFDKSAKKGTPFVEFLLKIQQALDDVDEDDLKLALTKPDGSVDRLQDKTIKHTIYYEATGWILKEFLESLGFTEDHDMTPRQMIAESVNREVLVTLRHEPTDDGRVFSRVAKTTLITQ